MLRSVAWAASAVTLSPCGRGWRARKAGEPGEGSFEARGPLTRPLASLASTLSRKGSGPPLHQKNFRYEINQLSERQAAA